MTKEERSIRMSKIRSASTKPELAFRRAIWRLGFRYRVNEMHLPGKPDIVLPKYRTVVFVHGCFWHGHKCCRTSHIPETNTDFWIAKITRNQERDQEVWRQIEAKGWFVIVVWECELKKADFSETISRVETEIKRNGELVNKRKEERMVSRAAYLMENKRRNEKVASLLKELNHFSQ